MCVYLLRVMTLIFGFRSSTSANPCIVLHVRGKTFQLNKVIIPLNKDARKSI